MKSPLMKKMQSMTSADYWKAEYENLAENVEPMEKRLEQLEEELKVAVTENGQLRDLLERSLKTNNELTDSLTGVKTQYESLEATLDSLGIQV